MGQAVPRPVLSDDARFVRDVTQHASPAGRSRVERLEACEPRAAGVDAGAVGPSYPTVAGCEAWEKCGFWDVMKEAARCRRNDGKPRLREIALACFRVWRP